MITGAPTSATHKRSDLPSVVLAFLFSADDERVWLALPYPTLLRAAEQFEREGSPEDTGVMVDPTTGHPYHGTEGQLYEEFKSYCEAEKLPWVSADELLHEDLTEDQRKWVSAFVLRWDAALGSRHARLI